MTDIRAGSGGSGQIGHEEPPRGLLMFCALLGLLEAILYGTIAPLIPQLARELGLSAAQVGTLTAAYPAGLVVATVPVGYAASRLGSRRTAVLGLWLLALGSFGFAFLSSAVTLDLARLLQGIGSAAAWAGAMSWLAAVYAVATRGGAMGATISAAFFGTVIGPLIGAVAASVGRQVTFTVVGAGLVSAALWGGPRYMQQARSSGEHRSPASIRHSLLFVPLGTFVALGVASGTVLALGPLLLTERGFSPGGIAICFVAAAAPQVLFTAALGRQLGRSGLVRFCIAMMFLYGLLIPLTALATGQLMTAILFPLVVGVGWVVVNPLMLLTSAVADRVEMSQGLAMSLANGTWGGGAALGALALTRVADATSISTALIAAGVIALLTGAMLAVAMRTRAALTHDAPA